MWLPESWKDVEGMLGEAVELSTLEFKRELGSGASPNAELAKDIASMTLNGGVIIIGLAEDKRTRTASEISAVTLSGMEERIRQVAGSLISPAPELRIASIASPTDARLGIVVVEVPASPQAPHQTHGRFPCRDGVVTRFLSEPEIARLYEQRQRLRTRSDRVGSFDSAFHPDQRVAAGNGIGALDLVVNPVAPAASGVSAWQGDALAKAAISAESKLRKRFSKTTALETFYALAAWAPERENGWLARSRHDPATDPGKTAVFGLLTYPDKLAFQARWGLLVQDTPGRPPRKTAQEPGVAGELAGLLAFAGEYFGTVHGGGLLRAELELRGFDGAKSASRFGNNPPLDAGAPSAPNGIHHEIVAGTFEFSDTPDELALRLIDRWLAAFCPESEDFFRWIR